MSVISGSDGTYPKQAWNSRTASFFWDVKFEVLNDNPPSGRDLLAGAGRRICLTTRTTKGWDLGKPVVSQVPEEGPGALDRQRPKRHHSTDSSSCPLFLSSGDSLD